MKIKAYFNELQLDGKKLKILFLSFTAFLFSLTLQPLGKRIVTNLFLEGHFAFLNFFSRAGQNRPLDFYVGRFQEAIFGPLAILFSGLALLAVCVVFLGKMNKKNFALLVFGYWLVTKFEVMLFPPYGDAVSGPFIEAVWLLHNQFDYLKLARETVFVDGGPKVYLISLYPTFQALLMKVFSRREIFLVINHLIAFGLGAVIVTLMREIFLKIFSKKISLYLTFLLFFLPLFQSQVEQVNMEIPVLFFVVFSLYDLINKRIFRSMVMATLALFVKAYAIYIGVAVFLVALCLFFFDQEKKKEKKILFSGLASLLFVGFGCYGLLFLVNTSAQVDKVGVFQGLHLIKKFPLTYFFIASLFLFIVQLFLETKKSSGSLFVIISNIIQRHFPVIVMHLCSLGWFALFLNSSWIPPRYTLILLPSVIVCMAQAVLHLIQKERVLEHILLTIMIITMLSSYGAFYPAINDQNHSVTERSLEYRNDLKLHIKLAQIVEKNFSSFTIAAPFTFAQMLAFPEIGYLDKKLDVMIYFFPCRYEGIRNFSGLKDLDISRVLWVGVKTPFMKSPFVPVGPYDKVIMTQWSGNKNFQLFFGGFSIDIVHRAGTTLVERLKERGILRKSF